MDTTSALTSMFTFFAFLYAVQRISTSLRNNAGKKRTAPLAGDSWPVIGHLYLLGGQTPPHKVLGNMADKYGPIFTIKLGVHRSLVVSNWEIAKECLTTNDKAFANRPRTLAMEVTGYDFSILGFSLYGPFWRYARKIVTHELLSNQWLETLKHVREAEMRTAMKELYKLWDQKKCNNSSGKVLIEMKRWIEDINSNVIFKVIGGKSVGYETIGEVEDSENWKHSLREFIDYAGRFVLSDAFPFMRWLDIRGTKKTIKRIADQMDVVVEKWLREHKQKRDSGVDPEDFMGLMLNILDEAELASLDRDADTINKARCMTLIIAGSDTTTVSLIWALSLLINHTKVLKKVQQELDIHIGKDRQVQKSDLKNLVYLQAVIKEALRLYPAATLSIPHESMEDCTVAGYRVPVGTRLFVNLWKLHRDPRVWSNPSEFRPERFLSTHKDLDLKGRHFELMPFSSGRRMCPGASFAVLIMQLTLAKLLHGFDFVTPSGEPLDMTETSGITNLKETPIEVLFNPRLPVHVYS